LKNLSDHSTIQPERRQWNPFHGPFRRQKDADAQLRIVSQPPDIALNDLKGYDYIPEAGKRVTIYVVDTGANLQHPVSILSEFQVL